MKARAAFLSLILLLVPGCSSRPAVARDVSDGRYTMGTILEISLHGLESQSAKAVLDELYAVAERLDGLLSIYQSDSAISRLNRAAGRAPQQLDADVAEILDLSIAYWELTLGTFDVTVGPVVELWKTAAIEGVRPTAAEIARARTRVGTDKIVRSPDGAYSLARAGMNLDLGGIAKGYALDRMIPHLTRHGIGNALLNFGQSSVWALGAPPGSEGWRLAIRNFEGDFSGLITLRDQALSVSESVADADDDGAHRYGHMIDPRSGAPLTEPRQALVVAPQASLAEALSKALLILDAETGLALVAAQPGCEGLLMEGGGVSRSTPGWSTAVKFEKPAAWPAP